MTKIPDVESPTVTAIYEAYELKSDNGFRPHLGASVIGRACDREIWSIFRWITKANHEGRVLRLFDTGNHAEPRMVADIRATGATCLDVDPTTGRQFRVEAHGAHFGGSLDGVAKGLREAPETWHVAEFKTHGNKSFQKLKKEGVNKSKPEHFAQMQVYMHLTGMTRAFYLAVNKDTDELYSERIRYDKEFSEQIMERAGKIIFAKAPPSRQSEDPSYWECKFCDHWGNCHGGELANRNCRTCLHSTPNANGDWVCELAEGEPPILTVNEQEIGCPDHRFIPPLIAGEQIDLDGDVVVYEMRDGTKWKDEGT
ncbi:MAG: oxidoreductase [Sneathiella sp.]